MALVKHSDNDSGGVFVNTSSPVTFNLTQHASAADRVVVVQVSVGTGSGTVSGVTYGGDAMTQVAFHNSVYPSQHRMYTFVKVGAKSGANNVVTSFGSIPFNYVSIGAVAYTGCSGVGNVASTSANTTNLTDTLAISANSIIQAQAIGNAGSYVLQLPDGVSRTLNYSNLLSNQSFGANSANLTAGTKTCRATAGNGMAMQLAEVQEAVTATPDIIISTGSLSGFTYAEGSGPSAEQTFTVSGDDLTASVTATAPTNYEVSVTSGSGFGASVVLTQTAGNLDGEPKTVYVRLKAGLSEATYNSEDISLTSTGAVTETVTLNGSVTAAPGTAEGNWLMMF
jgi:hypothetical protein